MVTRRAAWTWFGFVVVVTVLFLSITVFWWQERRWGFAVYWTVLTGVMAALAFKSAQVLRRRL